MNKEIGSLLKKRREEKGLSFEEAYKTTKIQISVLKYLEEGIAEEKLGPVYTRGFLRIYAKFLGLDLFNLLKEEAVKEPAPKVISRQKFDADRVKNLIIERWDKLNFKPIKFGFLAKKEIKFIGLFLLALVLIIFFLAARKKESPLTTNPLAKKKAAAKEIKKPVAIPEKLTLLIRAKDDSWLQVKCDAKVVFQRILSKGSVERWDAKNRIELWVGNAGGLLIELNGQPLDKLGRRGQVIKNIVMTKEGVTVGK